MLATAAVLLAGCGASQPSPHAAPPSAATSAAPSPQQSAGTGKSCQGVSADTKGVLALYCQGTAHITVSVDSKTHEFTTGDCTETVGVDWIQAGVQASPDTFEGPLPDYVGLTFNRDSPNTSAQFTIDLGGKQYTPARDMNLTISPDHKHIQLQAKANHDIKDVLAAGQDLPPVPAAITADCP